MTEEEKALSGKLFCSGAPELVKLKLKAHNLNIDFNRLHEDCTEEREAILAELVGHRGENVFLQGPVTFHYGCHTSIGDNTFINFNFTVQDDARVFIGSHCNFGPNVTIVTPMHPKLPEERRKLKCPDGEYRYMCYALPVTIGNDCWLGANVVICPGVTIGNGCIIGAGSVVTKDIPDGTIAAGNPAKVLRKISPEDSLEGKEEFFAE